MVIGQIGDVSGLMSFDQKNRSRQITNNDDHEDVKIPIIFVLDNAHLMDVASW